MVRILPLCSKWCRIRKRVIHESSQSAYFPLFSEEFRNRNSRARADSIAESVSCLRRSLCFFLFAEAGRNDSDPDGIVIEGIIDRSTPDDIGIRIGCFGDDLGCFVDLKESQVFIAGDIDDDAFRAIDAAFEKRAVDSHGSGVARTVVAGADADAHERFALVAHDGPNV